jgi:CRISPR-associated protein Cas1
MFFRKSTSKNAIGIPAGETNHAPQQARKCIAHSSAETAHLIGPGCVKLQAETPVWQPVDGQRLSLHPKYLKRILCYGNVDFSTASLHLFWKRGIHIAFLSQDCQKVHGYLQPPSSFPNLARLQHLAAEDSQFVLSRSRMIVSEKLSETVVNLRYFQRQSVGSGDYSKALATVKECLDQIPRATQIQVLRGIEGRAAAVWFDIFANLLPKEWTFQGRRAHPPADPVNALLSLGYTLATTRCSALLSAYGLDPRVGFFHQIRPGRDSLACDLVESIRIPLVDRLVLKLLRRQQLKTDAFESENQYRLKDGSFRFFLKEFEEAFQDTQVEKSFQMQLCLRLEALVNDIRVAGRQKRWEVEAINDLDK